MRVNIPPVTRILLGALLLQSVFNAAIRYRQRTSSASVVVPWLTLVPAHSLIYPWTFVTTTLVESNILTLAAAALTLFHGGRYLERAWSSREFAKFLVVVSLIPNFLCFLVTLLFSTITGNVSWRFSVIAGTIPLQVAFLVAFSQLVPAHTVTLFRGVLSMRVPRFPLVYLGVLFVLSLTPLYSSINFVSAVFGFLTSWTYLRFYKTVFPDLDSSQPSSLRGDASETFAFVEFFPGPAKPFVGAIADQVFNVLVALRICTPFSAAEVSAASQGGNSFMPRNPPGGVRAEAERRRALALKALDQRLHAATAAGGSNRSHSQPPSQTAGPTVHTQPQASAQTAMTSQPSGSLLGETSYNPDQESSDKSSSSSS
ncbi:eukaryotic integral membrane protein-domain-containing protein [Microdochium trichocladiopsis]|uniref:Eukaryotic integral membrane protein-domain-containing protein n=1 Tax=Microdochium trichocladiopsis TaxID=1682393 RepID=A0A9P8YGU7_9PEZI|nr:eukaryotic integral membrane protein-domain-containing protein [Microdochium trichocladiopsis]KAH7040144.1 eukaryotic integral membrane protein-domain-containing protein [Microdochium trichocladiopsis]